MLTAVGAFTPILGEESFDEYIFPRTLLAVAVIIVVARLMGALFKRLRQPAVVGEIIGGILLGPTFLGALPGDLDTALFPLAIRPFLKVLANVGLVIFMFIVGLELDMKLIRGKEKTAGVISLCSIILPFTLGTLLALGIYSSHDIIHDFPELGTETVVDKLPFALFIGASMSITAFPVLARILTDRGMYRTQIGALTLACAAVDDVVAWSLLAIVLAVVDSSGVGDFPRIVILSVGFIAIMFGIVKPLLEKFAVQYRKTGRLTPDLMAVILVGILVSAWATSEIGIHHIFGAFVFGAVMPRRETHAMFHDILEGLESITVVLLLPVFFVATGLNVDVTGLSVEDIPVLLLILATAIGGKFIGAAFGARTQRIPWRKSGAIGTLMNTRGLTELVILTIGREKGVLDESLFTMLVVMAVITTVMTEPVLRIFYPDRLLERDVADAAKAQLEADAFRVVAVVDDAESAGPLVEVAAALVGPYDAEIPAELVLLKLVPFVAATELGSGLGAQLDDMTESLSELHVLAAAVEARGVRCVARSQFSSDPPGEMVAQLEIIDTDVVLVAASADGSVSPMGERLLAEAQCDVGIVHATADPGGSWVATVVGGGPHRAAAAELAARTAVAHKAPVFLVDDHAGRRVGMLRRDLGRVDVEVLVPAVDDPVQSLLDGPSPAPGPGSMPWPVVLVPHGGETPVADLVAASRSVVVVRGREGSDDGRVEAFMSAVRDVGTERRLRASEERLVGRDQVPEA